MQIPSSRPLYLALASSLLLHTSVILGALYLVASTRVPQRLCASVAPTTDRLSLSIVFGSVGPSRQPAPIIDTKKDAPPPPIDADVKLDPSPSFNEVKVTPPSPNPVAALVQPALPTAVGTAKNSGGSGVQGVDGQGAGGANGISFFQVVSTSRSVVYVIDRSGSMGSTRALKRAKEELVVSLQQLPAATQFQVVAYNHNEPHCLVGPNCLVTAQPETIAPFVRMLDEVLPSGQTKHIAALKCALLLKPEIIFWVTDGDDFSLKELNDVLQANRVQTVIHVIEMASYLKPPGETPLTQLAKLTGGTYRVNLPPPEFIASPGLPPR